MIQEELTKLADDEDEEDDVEEEGIAEKEEDEMAVDVPPAVAAEVKA